MWPERGIVELNWTKTVVRSVTRVRKDYMTQLYSLHSINWLSENVLVYTPTYFNIQWQIQTWLRRGRGDVKKGPENHWLLKTAQFQSTSDFLGPFQHPLCPYIGQFVFVTEYIANLIFQKRNKLEIVNWFSAIWSVLSVGLLRDALLQTNYSEPHGSSISMRESIQWGTSQTKSDHKNK